MPHTVFVIRQYLEHYFHQSYLLASSNFQAVEFLAPIMVGILFVLDSPDVPALEVFANKKKEKGKRHKHVSVLALCIKK